MTVNPWLRYVARAVSRPFIYHVPVKVGGGWVRVPIVHGTGLQVVTHLRADAWKIDLYRRLLPLAAGQFVDVGVNLGQTLIQLRQIDPLRPYVGFEPNPACLHYVDRLVRGMGYQSCDFVAAGLGEQTGILSLYSIHNIGTDTMATVRIDLRPNRDYDARHVPIFSEEHLGGLFGDRPLGIVKIDVEGAELEVLRGLSRLVQRDRPLILCEVLFTDSQADLSKTTQRNAALVELLNSIGYGVWQIGKSRNNRHVVALDRREAFPAAFYDDDNEDQCDYLFLPRKRAGLIVETVLTDPAALPTAAAWRVGA